ncbi:MAG: hypothetical protein H6974_13010 [Gammaproteobacteria bacterium]|nr:hypothetical protein [Gammaproteobacteria bacterium]
MSKTYRQICNEVHASEAGMLQYKALNTGDLVKRQLLLLKSVQVLNRIKEGEPMTPEPEIHTTLEAQVALTPEQSVRFELAKTAIQPAEFYDLERLDRMAHWIMAGEFSKPVKAD